MKNKISPSELDERIQEVLEDISKKDYLELVNNILGTEYKLEDVDWEE